MLIQRSMIWVSLEFPVWLDNKGEDEVKGRRGGACFCMGVGLLWLPCEELNRFGIGLFKL
jgi:hypothetical protein